jgi:AT-rich interactive domain-containing protein 1
MSKFFSYYKNGSLSKNDSRSSEQLINYSNKILDKYCLKKQNKNKKQKLESSLPYLKTHFNTNDELVKMEKLFFGQKYYQQKQSNNNEERDEQVEEEDEQAIIEEECLFKILSQKEEELMQRCICISTIIRNLTFVPGNDIELCKNTAFIKIIGILIKFKHKHNFKLNKNDNNNEEDNSEGKVELNNEWWWECVHLIRENTLVTISNISGAINLNNYEETIIKLFIDGLIHWSICKSSDAVDVLITLPDTSTITAQRLAIESLSKMTIFDVNIDLIMATLSDNQLDNLFNILSEWLVRRDEQTLREFSIVLLTSIAKCDQLSTKLIAKYF